MVLNNFIKAAALSTCLGLASGTVLADVETNGGLHVYDANDSNHWFNLNGKMQVEQNFCHSANNDANKVTSSLNLRRVQTDLKGGIGQDLSYSLRLSASGNNAKLSKASVTYKGFNSWSSVSVGNVDAPYGLSDSSSIFTERNVAMQAFAPSVGSDLGLSVTASNDKVGFNWSVHQPSAEVSSVKNLNTSARLSFAPLVRDNLTMHLGANFYFQNNGSNAVQLAGSLTNQGANMQAVDLQGVGAANETRTGAGFDAAVSRGPLFLQGELHMVRFNDQKEANTNMFLGYNVEGSYALTGESRDYNRVNGSFSEIRTDRDSGSWQVSARHSALRLGNTTQNTVGVGVAWTVNNNLRLVANYNNALLENNPQGALSLRLQAAW